MNNQPSIGEQMLLLQNIAYVKQFMQKGSVKVLFLVTLLSAIANGLFTYSFKEIYDVLFKFIENVSGVKIIDTEEFFLVADMINSSLTISSIVTVIFGLILPVTLLYIIIRSRSDNPSVVPSGAVKFLYVLSFIQTIAVIAICSITAIAQFFSIFAADSIVEAVISFIFCIVYLFVFCFYYILQTKFLGAIKHSCTGYSLIYGSSKGFGTYSVIIAICSGIMSAISIVISIVCYSLFSSNDLESNPDFDTFLEMGGTELFEAIKPIAVIFIAITILYTLYYVLLAVIAFSYKDMVAVAVRESFVSHKNIVNTNSAFKTYGGSNSYTNYNYSSSNSGSQQNYATASNTNNTVNNDRILQAPVDSTFNPYNNQQNVVNTTQYNEPVTTNDRIPQAPVDSTFNPYNNQQNNVNATQYNEPVTTNGSFTPVQQQFENNNINREPVTTGGSFGIQQDSNNNY